MSFVLPETKKVFSFHYVVRQLIVYIFFLHVPALPVKETIFVSTPLEYGSNVSNPAVSRTD